VVKREACFDLIIGNMPDRLPISNVSLPPDFLPKWNTRAEDWSELIFEFARDTLQDDGAILIFQPDVPSMRVETDLEAEAYGFKAIHDWWGINEFHLTSYRDQKLTVSSIPSCSFGFYCGFLL
jgi:hypothetical protein